MMKIPDIESDPVEKIDEIPAGSRMYVVSIYDPLARTVVSGATVVEPDRFEDIDRICADNEMPYRSGLLHAAAEQVVRRMFNGAPPDGYKIESVHEVSKRELKELINISEQYRQANFAAGQAS